MLKHILIYLALFCWLSSTAWAEPLTLNQILEATCRVTSEDSVGSGICISHKNKQYQILTNAHVVGNLKKVNLEFFRRGKKTNGLIPATVSWKRYLRGDIAVDFAIISVDEKYFGKYPPRVIPLVPNDFKIKKGDYITSAGCPEGRWATGWEGSIWRYAKAELKDGTTPKVLLFHPPAQKGQSGSGLLMLYKNKKGEMETRVAALITWRFGKDKVIRNAISGFETAKGGAIPISVLYKVLNGKIKAKKVVPTE